MTHVQSPADAWKSAEKIKEKWRAGSAPDAAAALKSHPDLIAHRSVVIDLAYEEYLLREKNGVPPDAAEFARLFPEFQASVKDLIEAHCLLKAEPERLPITESPWPAVGEMIEGLELRRELGRGAFGRAYLAFDPALGRHRVLKATPGGQAEARMIGGLRHPNVTDVLWTRPVGERTAVCMPFVGSATLASLVDAAKGEVPTARLILDSAAAYAGEPPDTIAEPVVSDGDSDTVACAAIGAALARAVAYLHGQGVVHADIKPSNVVLQPGASPQLIDFNLAAGEEPAFAIRGTPAYMAPELLDATLANRRPAFDGAKADVFALGVTLVELLTGRHPYRTNAVPNLAALAEGLRKCRPAVGDLPATVGDVLKRSLAVDPAARPTAAEIADALDVFVNRARTRGRRRQRTAIATALSIVFAGLAVFALLKERAPQTASEFHERGLASLRAGKADAARADFISAHEKGADPKDLALAAYCYSLGGDQGVASDIGGQAIEGGADTAEVRNNRGAALLKQHKPEEAIKELDAALKLAKDLRPAKYNRAVARYLISLDPKKRDQLPAALADMDDVVKAGPFTAELHMDAARLYALASSGNPGLKDRAFEQLDAALKLGQQPAKLAKDVTFKANLASDPRFGDMLKREQMPAAPQGQLHFVEPFQK